MHPPRPSIESPPVYSSPKLIVPELPSIPGAPSSTGTSPTDKSLQNSLFHDHDHGFLSSSTPSMLRRRRSDRKRDREVTISPATSRESSVDQRSDTPSWLEKFSPRPWKMTPRKKEPVPKEQTEAYLRTRARVELAVDLVKATTRTALEVAGEVGEVAPGLSIAARLLSNIWDAVEGVDSNRLACLRLTERCAEILLAVHEELDQTDIDVEIEMKVPLERLEESFTHFHDFLIEQNSQPFWARYLKRDDILRDIENCDKALNDALFLFNMRIQIRLMKNIKGISHSPDPRPDSSLLLERDIERQSSADELGSEFEDLDLRNLPSDGEPRSPSIVSLASVPLDDLAVEEAYNIRNFLSTLQEHQNQLDRARDSSDIRQLLACALKSDTDREMIHVLQMGKHDMLHAIRYFLEAWETRPIAHPSSSQILPRKDLSRVRSLTWPLDERQNNLLDKGYLNPDTLSGPVDVEIPSWTISKSQVSCQELVGQGFFSHVYKGTWRHRTVAIKILERSTPQDAFISEFEVWKTLQHHPNVLKLYGTSDPEGPDSPRFFVSPYMKSGSLPEYLRRLEWEFGGTAVREDVNKRMAVELARFMLEIARGMEHLHECRIVHGDLKGANVLVDSDSRCVIADFGHSKPTSQITHANAKHNHGFRWQSPELMAGQSLLSPENDVYAFAITSVEVLTMGSLPWPMLPDNLVRIRVLDFDERPDYPVSVTRSLGITRIIQDCWNAAPLVRPTFSKIVRELEMAIQNRTKGTST